MAGYRSRVPVVLAYSFKQDNWTAFASSIQQHCTSVRLVTVIAELQALLRSGPATGYRLLLLGADNPTPLDLAGLAQVFGLLPGSGIEAVIIFTRQPQAILPLLPQISVSRVIVETDVDLEWFLGLAALSAN